MHGKPCLGERSNPIRGVTSLRNAVDCRALKMPGYLFLLGKADKQRTKDPGLCNLGCSSPATILRHSQGGGGRMSSRQEAPSVAIISPRHCGRKPCRLPCPAPGRSTRGPSFLPGEPSAHHRRQRVHAGLCQPTAMKISLAAQPGNVFSHEQTTFFRRGGAGGARPSRASGVLLASLTTVAPSPSPALQLLGPHPCPARGQT